MTRTACLLCILSGFLLIPIFPWYDIAWLAWVAFVPLLVATRAVRPRTAFLWGWLSGCIGYLGILRWIPHTMINYGGVPIPASYGILVLLVAYVGAYVGIFAAGWSWGVQRWPRGVLLLVPALWVALEWVRAQALSGFPWASLGYSQYLQRSFIQIAEFTSVYGVSFCLMLGNLVVVQLLQGIKQRLWYRIGLPCLLAILGIIAVWGWGWWYLQQSVMAEGNSAAGVEVALIQGNIDQSQKWDADAQEAIVSIYHRLTREAAADPLVDLIVWPEAATPFFFTSDRYFQARQLRLVQEVGRPLLFGSPTHVRADGENHMYNSAFLVGRDSTVQGRYDKIHLVPFGEYIPLRHLLFFLDKLVYGIGDFRHGTDYTVMAIPQGRFGVLICFEIIFPDLVRHFVDRGAQFLVNLTNDAWFGDSPASYQHLSMVVFRAIENRVPIVRAANTGISAAIDPTGRLLQQTGLYTRTWIKERIMPAIGPAPFYTRFGDIFAYGCILLTVLALVGEASQRGQRRSRGH
jgi:apolipoprotein N-acyltransferase